MTTTDYRFCPRCARPLIERADPDHEGGRLRHACPDDACGYVHWNNPLPVVAAIVELDGKILLARNAAWPEGMFALITGFLENGETPEDGIAREVREETGLNAEQIALVGVYEFIRKNELIIAYHVRASGTVTLSPELLEYRLVDPPMLRPWRAGTGYALADWMRARGLDFQFVDRPGQ
ncbi:NUDIX domain-containing protein [Burkholderia multivorans]|uniref:NUDIX domain-containing protein n=1 Tax=Burkholderia multivorans TaxID=87883 RepID=UPI000F4DD890|nr:NUDIX domain-containing protein [Burkholderia multivorans]AYY60833.1 NUDIX domain-containing protein [Burkholderia multivorans]MBU9613809.1 NUDIX domain-containing protein [Burkholderia multivorans]MCA8440956.1 NUDIX domain-containing protein [Burkholderia multivorans]